MKLWTGFVCDSAQADGGDTVYGGYSQSCGVGRGGVETEIDMRLVWYQVQLKSHLV